MNIIQMPDTSTIESQFLQRIRNVKSEQDASKLIRNTIGDMRAKGFGESVISQMLVNTKFKLNVIDPFYVEDPMEWTVIIHAKVELFRMGYTLAIPAVAG